jgi:hypothetical protein
MRKLHRYRKGVPSLFRNLKAGLTVCPQCTRYKTANPVDP